MELLREAWTRFWTNAPVLYAGGLITGAIIGAAALILAAFGLLIPPLAIIMAIPLVMILIPLLTAATTGLVVMATVTEARLKDFLSNGWHYHTPFMGLLGISILLNLPFSWVPSLPFQTIIGTVTTMIISVAGIVIILEDCGSAAAVLTALKQLFSRQGWLVVLVFTAPEILTMLILPGQEYTLLRAVLIGLYMPYAMVCAASWYQRDHEVFVG